MRFYIFTLLLSAFFIGCSDENKTMEPTYRDVDWFAIKDSEDATEHLRYQLYRKTGISVFYTDTIGKEFRGINGYGDSIIHHEVLTPYYVISGTTNTITYIFSKDKTEIHNGIVFLDDQVIPLLIPAAYPRSFLLVEELILNARSTEAQGKREGDVYKGMMTTLVSRVGLLGTMTMEDKRVLATKIAATEWYKYLNENHISVIHKFCAISDGSVEWTDQSSTSTYNRVTNTTASGIFSLPYKPHWNGYGFLISNPNQVGQLQGGPAVYGRYYTPTVEQDVTSFIEVVLRYSQPEFQALYEGIEGVEYLIAKYLVIKEILDASRP